MQLDPEACKEGDLLVQLCCYVISTAVGLQLTMCTKKRYQRSVVMFTSWLQIKLTGWKLRGTFRKMTGKNWLLSVAGSCLQWLWVAARGLSLHACVWSSCLRRLWTALAFWQMKMTVKHDKDGNLMSRTEESGTSFLKSNSYIGRTPKERQDTKRVIVHFYVLQILFLARGRRFKISCEVILR